jgi:hypothetical protein
MRIRNPGFDADPNKIYQLLPMFDTDPVPTKYENGSSVTINKKEIIFFSQKIAKFATESKIMICKFFFPIQKN